MATEVPTREVKKIPTFNWVPVAFLPALPVCTALGWVLFRPAGS